MVSSRYYDPAPGRTAFRDSNALLSPAGPHVCRNRPCNTPRHLKLDWTARRRRSGARPISTFWRCWRGARRPTGIGGGGGGAAAAAAAAAVASASAVVQMVKAPPPRPPPSIKWRGATRAGQCALVFCVRHRVARRAISAALRLAGGLSGRSFSRCFSSVVRG
eukprot:scaffold1506_cov118-Isochrysis_galbana.AAC.2